MHKKFHPRLARVMFYFDAQGNRHPNTGRTMAPFRLMENVGDYFDVHESDCAGGNLMSLSSSYTQLLGRRFSTRNRKLRDGSLMYRVTLISLTLDRPGKAKKKPASAGTKRKLFRVNFFFNRHGTKVLNACIDDRARPKMYPFEAMVTGDYFFVCGSKSRIAATIKATRDYEDIAGVPFISGMHDDLTLMVTCIGTADPRSSGAVSGLSR